MDPQRRNLIFAIVVVTCVVALFVIQWKRATSPPEGVEQPAVTTADEAVEGNQPSAAEDADVPVEIDSEALLAALETDRFVYDYSNLRDPMTPVIYAGRAPAAGIGQGTIAVSRAHTLEGIVWRPYDPLASIDGTVVGIGERLADGAVVREILRDKVILSTDAGTFSVGFHEE